MAGAGVVLALAQPASAQDDQPVTGIIVCEVEIPSRKTTCGPMHSSHPLAGTAGVLSITGNPLWSVEASGDEYSPQDSTYRVRMRLLPLRSPATNAEQAGLLTEVFLAVPPTSAGIRGSRTDAEAGAAVHLRNPDGCRAYTDRGQPYRALVESPHEGIGAGSEWVFQVSPGIGSFQFLLGFYRPIPPSQPVPARAPNHFPAWITDPRNSIECTGVTPGTCPPNVLKVMFASSLSELARRAAIAAIDGWVVGGDSYVNEYYVQFLSDRSPQRLREALERIRAFPGVTRASPFDLIKLAPG